MATAPRSDESVGSTALLEVRGWIAARDPFTVGPLSFSLNRGQILLIFGPSLSGKTTLLKSLVGLVANTNALEHKHACELFFDAKRVDLGEQESLAALRAHVGMVFQNDALFDSLSALENVALPLRRRGIDSAKALERARTELDRTGLGDAVAKLPEQLSGGMRKRLGIARALAPDCPLLLVDEPLAGLDPATTLRIVELLEQTRRAGHALVIAVADPSPLWRVANRVIALESGRVVAQGAPSVVREQTRALLSVERESA
jgi:phospholipid/cholesterol/gamma-HCH transport system ATP-binding protein